MKKVFYTSVAENEEKLSITVTVKNIKTNEVKESTYTAPNLDIFKATRDIIYYPLEELEHGLYGETIEVSDLTSIINGVVKQAKSQVKMRKPQPKK